MNLKRKKILFICTINRMRSATAHSIYENDERFFVRSAGTDPAAAVVLSAELMDWADSIVVMEKQHRSFIRKHFPDSYASKRIVCLYIPDEYDFMDPVLVMLLKEKLEDVLQRGLL